MSRHRLGLAVSIALVVGGPASTAARAADCNRLYAAIQSAGRGDTGERWTRAAAQQQVEIDRTQTYANRLGCSTGFFGTSGPPSCDGLIDRLQKMRDNLAAMQDRAGNGGAESRAALVARYNEACVGVGGDTTPDTANLDVRGALADDGSVADPRLDPYDPDGLSTVPPNGDIMEDSGGGRPVGQAICVRTCDGGYFPLGGSATDDQLAGLDQLCQASCPNTEARLFTMPSDGDLAAATATDGTTYTALPAAFKFEKTFTSACTCKPPNQSWTEALAKAEAMLGDPDKHDITVTAALSDQMAKPGAVPVPRDKTRATRKGKVPGPVAADGDLGVAASRDGQKALQAPTASTAAAGIGAPARAERLVRQGEGERVSVAGPDGVTRTLRLIVP